MSPGVEAALIAGSVGVLTLVGTLVAQFYGIRSTRSGTDKTLNQQSKQLTATLAEQREQLDKTLAHQRDRTLNERFATAADRLGSDKPPAVRLAGVYAMAGLADDWPENLQTCVDILCAYLRLPYDPDPGDDAEPDKRAAYRANREVRHTIIRLICTHLLPGAAVSWEGLNFDFTGVVFDGGDFTRARFSGGIVRFNGASFASGKVDFGGAKFSGRQVGFRDATFSGQVGFRGATFSGQVDFSGAEFPVGGQVGFHNAEFSGYVDFGGAEFSGQVDFSGAEFAVGGRVGFRYAKFSGGEVEFGEAKFSGGQVDFSGAEFSRGRVGFRYAKFSGGQVDFRGAKFSGGRVDFGRRGDWSQPPVFDWEGAPPAGVMLPADADAGDHEVG
jgi:uncharacterized protein YjbI with pentapeptide repeats